MYIIYIYIYCIRSAAVELILIISRIELHFDDGFVPYVLFAVNATPDTVQRAVYSGNIPKVRKRQAGARAAREDGRLRRHLPGKRAGVGHRGSVQRYAALSARPVTVHRPVSEVESRAGRFQLVHEVV